MKIPPRASWRGWRYPHKRCQIGSPVGHSVRNSGSLCEGCCALQSVLGCQTASSPHKSPLARTVAYGCCAVGMSAVDVLLSCCWSDILCLGILDRRSRPHSVSDYSNSLWGQHVNVCVYVEPVLRSKDYVWSWMKIGSVIYACTHLYRRVCLQWRVYMPLGASFFSH